MITPTGSLSFVAEDMKLAREFDARVNDLYENGSEHIALYLSVQAKMHRERAALEFLFWTLAVLNMPEEPNPWQEYLAKEKAKKEKAENGS